LLEQTSSLCITWFNEGVSSGCGRVADRFSEESSNALED